MKYLILVVFIVIIWRIWKKRNPSEPRAQSPVAPEPQKMLVCRRCGVHFPESDGMSDQTGDFCCEAHHRVAGEGRE